MQEIICVLDKSGSMQSVKDDAVAGFNRFLDDQQSFGEANLTLCWFDNGFDVAYQGDIKKMKPLAEWPNGGMTALTDAIGKAFAAVKDRFSIEKPEKVVLAILTDGQENSSREFTKEAVAALISEHQEKYAWDVIFLAADQDAWAVAQNYAIHQQNAVSFSASNTVGGFADYSTSVTRSRMS